MNDLKEVCDALLELVPQLTDKIQTLKNEKETLSGELNKMKEENLSLKNMNDESVEKYTLTDERKIQIEKLLKDTKYILETT